MPASKIPSPVLYIKVAADENLVVGFLVRWARPKDSTGSKGSIQYSIQYCTRYGIQ